MKYDAIFDLFIYFSPTDWNDIINWSKSPIYKLINDTDSNSEKKADLQKLRTIFEYFYLQKDNLKTVNRNEFIKHLTEKCYQNINEHNIKELKTRLGHLRTNYINKFIGMQEMNTSPSIVRCQLHSLRYYSKHSMKPFYDDSAMSLNNIEKNELNTTLDIFLLYKYYDSESRKNAILNKTEALRYLKLADKQFNIYYYLTILEKKCALLNNSLLLNEEINIDDISLPSLDLQNENKALKFYVILFEIFQDIKLKKNPFEDSSIYILDELDKIKFNKLNSKVEVKTFYSLLITLNFYFQQIDYKNPKYFNLLIRIYSKLEKEKLITQRSSIKITHYKNYIFSNIAVGDLKNALRVKNKFKKLLPLIDNTEYSNYSHYTEALLNLASKNYSKALIELNKTKTTKNLNLDLKVRRLLILIYIFTENGSLETAIYNINKKISRLKNDKVYLAFNEIEMTENFSKLIYKLYIKSKRERSNIELIDKKPLPFLERKWLLEYLKIQN